MIADLTVVVRFYARGTQLHKKYGVAKSILKNAICPCVKAVKLFVNVASFHVLIIIITQGHGG